MASSITCTTPCGRYEIHLEAINPSNSDDILKPEAQNGYAVMRIIDLSIDKIFNPFGEGDNREIAKHVAYCDITPLP